MQYAFQSFDIIMEEEVCMTGKENVKCFDEFPVNKCLICDYAVL